jgi:hypothetical protein
MRQYTYLATILVCFSFSTQAQHWKWEAGLTNTNYSFQTSTGQQTNFMKPNGGVHFGFAFNKEIIDTTALISKFSKSAIFFGNNKILAKVVSFFRYEAGLNLTQLNAVGDVQNRQLSYQTSFAGLHLAFGPEVKIYRGFSIALLGKFAPMKMINGTQQRDMNYFSLSQDPSFSKVQLFYGYNISIHKRLAEKTSVYFSYDVMNTVNKAQANKSNLNFEPSIISIGMKISQF